MAEEIWIRCPHCGQPHARATKECPRTGKPLSSKRISRRLNPPPELPRFPSVPPSSDAKDTNVSGRLTTARNELPKLPADPSSSADISAPHGLPLTVGDVLENRYVIHKFLGAGAMGSVFEAEHRMLGKRVAIKVLDARTAADVSLVSRFRHEARAAGALGHPNLCKVYDLSVTPAGLPYIVMELLRGETLAERITRLTRLSFLDTLHIAQQILAGLGAAHAAGILHRDVKPANVFLVGNVAELPVVKIIDFGIAKNIATERSQVTVAGHIVGTPAYMAPELVAAQPFDRRVDLYAVGVVLYECITGNRPFESGNLDVLFRKIQGGLFPTIRLHRADVPTRLETAILRAMHRDPEKRFHDASEMAAELRRCMVEVEEKLDDTLVETRKPSFD